MEMEMEMEMAANSTGRSRERGRRSEWRRKKCQRTTPLRVSCMVLWDRSQLSAVLARTLSD